MQIKANEGESGNDLMADVNDTEEIVENDAETQHEQTTRYGRVIRPVQRLINEMTAFGLSEAETNYYLMLATASKNGFEPGKFACVGAGLGGGFNNTKELHVMKYDEAMQQPDANKWKNAVMEEHERMTKYDVWNQFQKVKCPREPRF